jgi:hypothetical protein
MNAKKFIVLSIVIKPNPGVDPVVAPDIAGALKIF